ncbi:PadR family transcriptional regulator [Dehalococcoides mccartyi]|nr:PadR family transcriptional regulator [Dehalococcoides mccartyi]
MAEQSPLPKSAYVILGLLSFGESSGYDLKNLADQSVALFYSSPARSQIYTELRRLTEHGLAVEREVEQTDRPDKRLYSITKSGEEVLKNWLENSPTTADAIKSHLLLKVFFGSRIDRPTLIEEVRRYRDEAQQFRGMLSEIQKECDGVPGSLFTYLTIGQGLLHAQANESWANEAIQLLENADDQFTWSSKPTQSPKSS